VESGEVDVDLQTSLDSCFGIEHRVVGIGDRLDDREPEPDPIGGGASVSLESLEGLKETGQLAARDHRARVRDREAGTSRGGVRVNLDVAARNVVTDGIHDQVCDEPVDQPRVAAGAGRLEC